jgi:hypothetical protein
MMTSDSYRMTKLDKMNRSQAPRLYSLDFFCCGEPLAHICNLDFALVASLAALDEYHKALDPRDTVALSTDFCHLNVVLFAFFNWFWATEAASSKAASAAAPSFSVTHRNHGCGFFYKYSILASHPTMTLGFCKHQFHVTVLMKVYPEKFVF